jgi:rhodanese-related sulfurtransferase
MEKTKMKNLKLNWTLILAIMFALGAAYYTFAPTNEHIKISAQEARLMMIDEDREVVVLDVRTQMEFEEGHIEGAINLSSVDIEQQVQRLLTDKHATILIYCQSGNRSNAVARIMVDMGYMNVYDFGSINGWHFGLVTE